MIKFDIKMPRPLAVRSPKVGQGSKAIEDTRGRSLDARAVLNELVCLHPVAKAFLLAQYGRVRKVDSEDELARTPQGLMEEGIGSRGYGMFSCRASDHDLAFGEATRKRRLAWCEQELSRLTVEIRKVEQLQHSLNLVLRMFNGAAFTTAGQWPRIPAEPGLRSASGDQAVHAGGRGALAADGD